MTYDPIADDGVQYAIDNPEVEGGPCPCGGTTFRESDRETETMVCTSCGQALRAAGTSCAYCQKAPADPGFERCLPCRTWRDEEWCDANGVDHGVEIRVVTISLEIENTYELYDDETTTVTDQVIPAPPADREGQAFEDWGQEHIIKFSGVGHEDGDSWHDVTVTACSDPTLVGHEFQWGY